MTHAELVRTTAEKMAAVRYGTGWDNVPNGIWKESATSEMIPLAELAVAMKAEGFDEGYSYGFDDCDRLTNMRCRISIDDKKQSLGLIKPTDNEQ